MVSFGRVKDVMRFVAVFDLKCMICMCAVCQGCNRGYDVRREADVHVPAVSDSMVLTYCACAVDRGKHNRHDAERKAQVHFSAVFQPG